MVRVLDLPAILYNIQRPVGCRSSTQLNFVLVVVVAVMNRQHVSFRLLWLVYFSSSFPASARSYSSYSLCTSASPSTNQPSLRSRPSMFNSSGCRGKHRRRRRSPFTTFATLMSAYSSPPLGFADTKNERPLSYQDLSPLGRLVAGTVEVGTRKCAKTDSAKNASAQVSHSRTRYFCAFALVVVVTVLEYASGMVSGYLLGSVTDVPRLLFRRVDVHAAGGWNQVTGRFVRLHNKSLRWGSRYQSSVCSSDDALSFLCESNLLQ
jgi:hypothetical protein